MGGGRGSILAGFSVLRGIMGGGKGDRRIGKGRSGQTWRLKVIVPKAGEKSRFFPASWI